MFKTPKTNCEFQIFSKDTNDNVVQFIYSPENQFIHLQTMNSDFFMKRKIKGNRFIKYINNQPYQQHELIDCQLDDCGNEYYKNIKPNQINLFILDILNDLLHTGHKNDDFKILMINSNNQKLINSVTVSNDVLKKHLQLDEIETYNPP